MRRLRTGIHCRIKLKRKLIVLCVVILLIQLRSLCNGYRNAIYDFTDLMLFACLSNVMIGVAVLLFAALLLMCIMHVKKENQAERVTYAYCCTVEDFDPMVSPPMLWFKSEAPYGLLTCSERKAEQLPNDTDMQAETCVTAAYANKVAVAKTYTEGALLTCERLEKNRWKFKEYIIAVPIVQLSERITNVLQLCAYVAMSSLYYVMTVIDLTQNTVINRISCICLYACILILPHICDYYYTQIKQILYMYFQKK